MDGMFEGANSFNQPIDSWDVRSVTDMRSMFNRAATFNQPIGSWNVRYVTNMSSMFSGASSFNQPIGSWDVSNVTSASGLFDGTDFNQDIISWNVESMTDMSNMFRDTPFNQDISSWNVSNVTNMSSMFRGTPFNQDISSWNVSKVTNMTSMFSNVDGNGSVVVEGKFNQDVSSWDVSNVTSVNGLFHGTDFNQDISSWNVESMTDMSNMFRDTPFNQDISSWNVSNVTGMAGMFFGSSFNKDISGWCVPKITSQPSDFSNNSPLIVNNKPVWGTCPKGSVDLYFSNLSDIPEKISLLSTSKVNNDIYITTGFIFKEPSLRISYDFLFKYNTISNSWSKISTNTSLEDLYYGNGEIINNKLYRFNGKTRDGLNSKLEIIDLQNLTVTLGQQNPLPRFLSGSSVNGIYIYVFGGETQQGYTNKLYRYNTETDTWLELPEMPESKQTKGEFVNNKLYVIGGFNGTPSNKIHVFNTSTNIWENEYTMPFNVSANGLTVNNNYIYILGDYSDQDKIEVLDTNDMSFRFLKNNMIDRRNFDAEIIDDKLYVIGGSTTSSLNSWLKSIQFSNINSVLSVNKPILNNNLLLYPNPTNDKLFIQGITNYSKILIYNYLGNLVMSKTNSNDIDVQNLPRGIYIIKIIDTKGETVRKFIKN
jgi:surface protein